MDILVIDDERLSLEALVNVIKEAQPRAEVFPFTKTSKMLEFVKDKSCDIAFLDIEMRNITGIELAKKLKDLNPRINIIFVTGYSEYMREAFSMHASGYVLKPATKKAVEEEIRNLRYPILYDKAYIRVQTFGNFEIFVDGKPVPFSRSKSKEMLAYLVDRKGSSVTKKEIAAALWEDEPYSRTKQFQLQTIFSEMMKSLKSVNIQDIIIKNYNSFAIDTKKIVCDYYDFIMMKPYAVNAYQGEYMSNYSWAEFTTGALSTGYKK